MFVDAAPVNVTAKAPFVVSADKANVQDGTLLIVLIAELTNVVVDAVPSRLIKPETLHAADAVPPAACCRATTIPVKA